MPDSVKLALTLLEGSQDDLDALQRVLAAAPSYFEIVTGKPPGAAEAQETFSALPEGKTLADKRVWGLLADGRMVGCADVIRGYPVREKAVIGLLLLSEPWQRIGFGRRFLALIEAAIAEWPEITTLRIGVVPENTRALAFWSHRGYADTGVRKLAGPSFVSEVIVMEKPLSRALAEPVTQAADGTATP